MMAGSHHHPRLRQWLQAGGFDPAGADDRALSGLTSDSRAVAPGYAFLALPGARRHGLEFIDEVLRAGAVAVLWQTGADRNERASAACREAGAIGLALDNLRSRLGALVSAFFGDPSHALHVIGVTGTDGKTSVTQMVAAALERSGRTAGVIGTLGWGRDGHWSESGHTTPDLVSVHAQLAELLRLGCSAVAMEVSSHGLDQGRVDGVRFDVAVLTNLGRDHLDYHGTQAAYAAAKRRLFERQELGAVVLNLDDAWGRELSSEIRGPQIWTYGTAADASIQLTDLRCTPAGLVLSLRTPAGAVELRSALLGRFNASNLMAALAVLLILELPLSEAVATLAAIGPVPGRMETFAGEGRASLVVDYAHTPQALEAALAAAREHCGGRLFCVFGCGGDRDRGKRPLMGQAAEALADQVIVTDDNPRSETPAAIVAEILAGMRQPDAVRVIHDRGQAIRQAWLEAGPDDVVLIAGKGHETRQLVGGQSLHFSDRETAASLQQAVRRV